MKKLLKILLVSTSLLSVGAIAATLSVKDNSSFEYSSALENNLDFIGTKKAVLGATVTNPTFTNGDKTIISPAVTQVKTNEDSTKSIRLVSAVAMEEEALVSHLNGEDDKEIGFHLSYKKVAQPQTADIHIRVENAYKSVIAGDTTYRASGNAVEGEKTITDWVNDCGTVVSADEGVTYTYFICLEIAGISEADYETIITAQPYIKDGETYTYASNYKKTNTTEKPLYFLDVDGTESLMKANPANVKDGKDEYMITKVDIEEGAHISIKDSYGNSHNKYEHSVGYVKGENFVAPKTCKYDFYYKTPYNDETKDETYINQQIVTHKLVTESWWHEADAKTGIYLIEKGATVSSDKSNGPGVLMNECSEKDYGRTVYEFDVDTFKYEKFYFTRVNPNNTNECWTVTKIADLNKTTHYLDRVAWSQEIY